MDTATTRDILLIHSAAVGMVLIVGAILLKRRDLFRWSAAGFWAWVAFAIYFVVNPLTSALSDNTVLYEIALYVSGGVVRARWIGLVIIIAIIVFILVYRRVPAGSVSWRLRRDVGITVPMWLMMILCIALGLASLITHRVGLVSATEDLRIEGGRFVGQVTGYEYVGHHLLMVPMILLCLSRDRFWRIVGWLAALGYVAAGFLDPWARYTIVSVLIALSLVTVVRARRRWPRIAFIFVVAFAALILQLRGHEGVTSLRDVLVVAQVVPENVSQSLSAQDSAMLSTFYVESYTRDTLSTYDFGIPLVNYIFFGYLPSRIFPWKYFLIDWLRALQTAHFDPFIDQLLLGAKSSLIGSFYSSGGLIGVLLLTSLAAWLSRKLDSMVHPDSPALLQAIGIVWMSLLWMVWGSHDFWAVSTLGVTAVPGLLMWLVAPKESRNATEIQPAVGEATAARP